MHRHICTAFALVLTIFLLGSASAGSNGDAPQEGQDWIITQDTHVWDSEVNVKDIVVNIGKTLKLENVNLSSEGYIDLLGDSTWINSTVYHSQSSSGDNVSLYANLHIINSELTLKSVKKNDGNTGNSIYLASGSTLIIRDFDLDSSTNNDRSKIRSDLSDYASYKDKWNYTVPIGVMGGYDRYGNELGVENTKVFIQNSDFEFIQALRFTGDSSYIKNSTFNNTGTINVGLDNLLFYNNSVSNSYLQNTLPWDVRVWGNEAIIEGNTFQNGTGGFILHGNFTNITSNIFKDYYYRGGTSVLTLGNASSNSTLSNNLFTNLTNIHALRLHTSDDNLIKNNTFMDAGVNWHTIMDRSGYRNHYLDNHFQDCNGKNESVVWYQTCIVFFYWSYPTDHYGGEHHLENNTFEGYKSAIRFNSYQNNNTVINNYFDRGFHGIGLWTWPQGTTGSSGNLISGNVLNDTYHPIALDYFYMGEQGVDNNITFNLITNTGGRGITVWSTYKNFTIHSNQIINASIGIWLYDDGYGGLSNGFIYNNTLSQIKYNGIQVATSWGSTFTINNIHIHNNHISTEGNGIYARDVEEGYIANNTIFGNLTHGSQAAGVVGYFSPELIIINNTISSAIGVEVGGISDASLITTIEDNSISVSSIGVLSNRTFTKVVNNNITGFCEHDKCPILYLQDVAITGIFSQEGNIVITNNRISKFEESVTVLLAEFSIEGNSIDFSEFGIRANNSDGELSSNTLTNTSISLSSYMSSIDIGNNIFTNFEKGVYSLNSTLNIADNFFSDGDFCVDLIDSDFDLITNDFDCRDIDYQVRYNIRLHIADEMGEGSGDHLFEIFNSEGEEIADSLTNEEGYSNFFQVDIIKKESDENVVNFNPLRITYANNNVPVLVYKNISFNHTIELLLDTRAPVTIVTSGESLIKEEIIVFEIILLEDNNDIMDYTVEYLVNDEFAEWEVYGTFVETTISFEGVNGKEYRFRSLGRDIYGNLESKEIFEYQVMIDTTTPETYLNSFSEDYYFTGSQVLDLSWSSNDLDISRQVLEVYYTNFTEPYLNPNSVTWFLIDSLEVVDEQSYRYELGGIGHYAFKILSEDLAGNLESKDDFDIIFNYDSDSDTLNFGNIPNRWGEDQLTIDYSTSSFNLDFDLFISLEGINSDIGYLTWYKYEYTTESNEITLTGLQDDTRYYFYAVSRDLAGNVEDPLNGTEYYSSNGLYDQKMEIKYIPLLDWGYNFIVEVDDNLDGIYETTLVRGEDQNRLKSNEYYLDLDTKTIIFGGLSNGGYVPSEDLNSINNVRVLYSGVQGIFEVYTGEPESASSLNIIPSNTTELVVSFVVPKDSQSCKVQRTTNVSKGYFNEMIIAPCESGLIEYIHTNPDINEIYFYRILIEDEFGHESISENRSIDMKDVVKLYSSTSDSDSSLLGMDSIIPITALVGVIMLGFGGVLLYRSRSDDILDENVTVIESKPVAKYKVEELYLIYKDGRLVKNLSDVEVKTDSDIMSGMLTAINDFVQDSFNTEGDLGSIDYGNNKIILQRGTNSYLAAVVYGEVDKFFKGKMINAVRNIENVNPAMSAWNGDAETIIHTEHYLQPIIDETKKSTKEMVDNYFSEKEIVLTTSYEKLGDVIDLQVHMSNYSPGVIKNCKLVPEYNGLNLSLLGIEPDVFYSFSDNSFVVGEVESYNEVTFKLKMKMKVPNATPLEIKMNYEQKGRKGVASSLLEIV